MNKKMSKRERDIKSKLMAAISMLLVSSIMMVSTTYAWFTLSTAPEVTGISTSVGANGNLEMALLPENGLNAEKDYGITTNVGDSTAAIGVRNTTWGNLVDLGSTELAKDTYGLHKITLYPSALNVSTWEDEAKLNPKQIADTMLKTPAYGADGRVSALKEDTITSLYVTASENFPQKAGTGVRAIGTAAGMTDRQLAYRNARSAASTAMAQAKDKASQSLNNNGKALGNIAVAKAMGTTAYKQADVAALKAIVNDLLGEEGKTGVLQYIEDAYKSYIIATGASASAQGAMDDTEFKAFSSAISGCATIEEVQTKLATYSITLPSNISTYMSELAATKATVKSAQTQLNALTGETITWADLSTPLNKLADMNAMTVNGYTVDQLAATEADGSRPGLNQLIGDVTSGRGIIVTMSSGGGVYADIADHCGNYTANVTLEDITYNGIGPLSMQATMETQSTKNYLTLISTVVTGFGAPTGGTGQTMPVTDFYGYIIDLAFRTNAAESNLLLQTTPVDRIYTNNTDVTAETMGGGSTMTFTATNAGFTQDQMLELMDAIDIIFMDPASGNVMATAKLDKAGATKSGDGASVTASIYLYEKKASVTTYEEVPADASGNRPGATHVQVPTYRKAENSDSTESIKYIADASAPNGFREAVAGEAPTHVLGEPTYRTPNSDETATHKSTTVGGGAELIKDTAKAVIAPLTQNVAKAVSALVYLDGENITNADVAANASTSMTGTLNLQFASSANLVPMNYTPLMNQNTTNN